MSGKQHKRERKRQRQAAREAARRQERRRTVITLAVIAAVIIVGGAVAFVTVDAERRAAAEQERELAERASDQREQASEVARSREQREVACGGEEPPAASEEKPTFDQAPEHVLEPGVNYRAVIKTSCGTLRLDLAEDRSPQAVNNFVFLARQGFYDGLEIFRNATTIGALQTGSGTNDASFQIGYTLEDELDYAREEGYPPGAVAMANSGPNTAGSQFFFVYNDAFDEAFQGRRAYTRFATVTAGLDVLRRIGNIPVIDPELEPETPSQLVYLERVTILPRAPQRSSDR